jgi:glycosyltransferase involved in cell wall biosynthesis
VLAVIETHPIQYQAPVLRALEQQHAVPVTAIYGSDFSVTGYHDPEFGARFAWDTDLLSGYTSIFLSRASEGGARSAADVSPAGIRAALRSVAPTAVLINGYSPRFHRAAWYAAWRGGYPILFRGETNDTASPRNAIKAGVRRAALSLAYRSCARCLYIGQRSREHFRRLGVDDARLVFSPYSVDPAPFDDGESGRVRWRSSMRAEIGAGDDALVVLFAGKLSHRKGVDVLIHALKRWPQAGRDRVVTVLVGDGDERQALAALAASAPRLDVRFAGFQNQRQLSRYYHAADLFVLPSRTSETWGLVVNEALHHGVPCVVSHRVGCEPDLIERDVTGVTFQAESVDALASALERARPLVGRPPIREACRRKVADYSVDRAAAGLAAAYRAVTSGAAATLRRAG